jgi:hypothetical protein
MRRALLIAAVAALTAAAAPAAGAATLTLDRGCYLAAQTGLPNGQAIVVRGEGFAPFANVTFSISGRAIGNTTANAAGAFATRFNAPGLAGGQFKATRTLAVSDGTNQATAVLNLRRLAADFLPSTGNPARLRVRFYVYGFGPLLTIQNLSTSQPVYEHVFDPRGRRRATYLVGRTSGDCGDLRTTRRRILPFPPMNGRWRFVFTTKRRYSRNSTPAAAVGFIVRTVFQPAT